MLSPLTSYTDQILSIHRTKSSAGFSLDIPLIMLVASMFRWAPSPAWQLGSHHKHRDTRLTGGCSVFYYPGAKYDPSLLIQALIMIAMQLILLKVALDHRPSLSRGGEGSAPFAASRDGDLGVKRPYNFWQWRSHRPYVWQSPAIPQLRRLTRYHIDTGISSSISSSPSSCWNLSSAPCAAYTNHTRLWLATSDSPSRPSSPSPRFLPTRAPALAKAFAFPSSLAGSAVM